MATEINVKVPPLAQKPASPLPAQAPAKQPIKASWQPGDIDPASEIIRVPEGKPDVLVFIKTPQGYQKVMEIDKGGDSLFGSGPAASEFTEILTEAISRKLSVTCKAAPGNAGIDSVSDQLTLVREQLDAKRRQDEFALVLLGIGIAAAVLCTIVYLVLGKLQGRGR